MEIVSGDYDVIDFILGSGGGAAGDLMVYNSAAAIGATDGGQTGAVVLGILLETGLEAAVKPIACIKAGTKIRSASSGTWATANVGGPLFDVNDAHTVDQTDTTGGFAFVTGYDNAADTVDFVVPAPYRYL
jgi:hypothetical protein